MDDDHNHKSWIRHCEAQEERERLSNALKGWWKLVRPFRAWHLYRKLRATNEASRRAGNERDSPEETHGPRTQRSERGPAAGGHRPGRPHPHRRRRWDRQDAHDGREGPRFGANRDRPARGDRLRHLHAQGRPGNPRPKRRPPGDGDRNDPPPRKSGDHARRRQEAEAHAARGRRDEATHAARGLAARSGAGRSQACSPIWKPAGRRS